MERVIAYRGRKFTIDNVQYLSHILNGGEEVSRMM